MIDMLISIGLVAGCFLILAGIGILVGKLLEKRSVDYYDYRGKR